MPSPSPKKQRKGKNKAAHAGLYFALLLCLSIVLYSTLFTRSYSPVQQPPEPKTSKTSQSQTSSTQTSVASTEPTPPTYKTYPDTGEKVATVLIDAGHGGVDGGKTTDNGTLEKDLNLAIAMKMGQYLEQLNPQIEVKYIRQDDNVFWGDVESDDLNYRLAQQWEQDADYYISLHCNSFADPSVEGTIFFINPDDSVTRALTDKMHEYLSAIGWAQNYQTIDDQLLQLVTMSDIHSMLIELAYMSNPDDLAKLNSEEKQDEVAEALAAAVSDYIMENPDAPQYQNQRYHHGQLIEKKDSASSSSAAAQ